MKTIDFRCKRCLELFSIMPIYQDDLCSKFSKEDIEKFRIDSCRCIHLCEDGEGYARMVGYGKDK